jgi:hypothetical protein
MADTAPDNQPIEPSPVSKDSPGRRRIARNIRAICVLYIVFGGIVAMGGIGVLFDESGDVPNYVSGILFGLGLGGVLSAIGVLRRKTWGIPFCVVISVFYLLGFPLGTLLAAYFLINIGRVKSDFL